MKDRDNVGYYNETSPVSYLLMILVVAALAISLLYLQDSSAQFTTPSAGGGTSDSIGVDTDADGVIDNYLYSTAGPIAMIKKGANITLTVETDTLTIAGPAASGTADSIAVDTTGDGAIDAYLYSSAGAIGLLRKGERMIFNVAIDTLYLNAENVAVSDSSAAFADSTDQITHGNIKDWHVDFGTGTGQVSSDDVTEGSSNLYDQPLDDSSNWSTAYGWGDHGTQNYLDDDTEDDVDDLDIDWGSGAGQVDTDDLPEGSTNKYDQPLTDSSNWSTAYSWGDHGAQNYLDDDVEDDVDDGDIDWGSGAGQVNLDDFDHQTAWRVFYSNVDGDVTELALGNDGEYLKSTGASSAPTWDTPAGGSGDDARADTAGDGTNVVNLGSPFVLQEAQSMIMDVDNDTLSFSVDTTSVYGAIHDSMFANAPNYLDKDDDDTDDLTQGSTNLYDQPLDDSANWSTAYAWGNHAAQNYLDDDVENDVDDADIDWGSGAGQVDSDDVPEGSTNKYDQPLEDSANWSTAYSWGDHSAEISETLWAHLDDTSGVLWTAIKDTTWDMKNGFIWSGAHEFTGGTPSLEIPNADAPSTDAEGEIAWDANDDALEVYSGDESESVLLPIYYDIEAMVFAPDGVNDYIPIFHVDALLYPHGIEIDQLSITLPTSTNYTLPVHEVGSDHAFDARIDSLVVSSAQYLEDGSPMDGNLDADDYIYLNIPSTDVDWIFVKIIYHVTEGS